MAVRKIINTWWVDFWFCNTRYRKRSPEKTRTGAKEYETTLRHKLARGEPIDNVTNEAEQGQAFEQFARKWFEDYVVPNNKYSEQRAKKYILSAFLIPYFGKKQITQITA